MTAPEISEIETRKPGLLSLDYAECVAKSATFSGGATLPKLLRYLAERALEEPGESVKEFRIATEAMGRGQDFDPRSDSAVRVTTARLRAKLHEYYEGEGRRDAVRLTIPKGAYRLEAAAAKPAAAGSGEPAAESGRRGRTAAWAAVIAVCALAAGYFLGQSAAPVVSAPVDPELARFWNGFAESGNGFHVIYSNVPHLDGAFRGGGDVAGHYLAPADDWHTGVGEVEAVYRLAKVANRLDLKLYLKRAMLADWDEVVDVNVVYLGGPAGNPQVSEIDPQANFFFEERRTEAGMDYVIRNRAPREGEEDYYTFATPFTSDYGVVRLTRGFRSGNWRLLLAGLSTFGTAAAAELVSDPHHLRSVRLALGQSLEDELEPFECVVRVELKDTVAFEGRPIACRSPPPESASGP